jgi:hypothetical protein
MIRTISEVVAVMDYHDSLCPRPARVVRLPLRSFIFVVREFNAGMGTGATGGVRTRGGRIVDGAPGFDEVIDAARRGRTIGIVEANGERPPFDLGILRPGEDVPIALYHADDDDVAKDGVR